MGQRRFTLPPTSLNAQITDRIVGSIQCDISLDSKVICKLTITFEQDIFKSTSAMKLFELLGHLNSLKARLKRSEL